MPIRRLAIGLVLALLLALPAAAQDFQNGMIVADECGGRSILTKGRDWLALAEQGDANGQFCLGVIYLIGYGLSTGDTATVGEAVSQEPLAQGAAWLLKAAEQGNVDGQYNLGLMYDIGQGVPQDYVQAHKWVNLSVSRSQGTAHEEAVQNRDWLEIKMTPAQVAEAQKLAREWKPKPNKSP